MIRLDQVCYTYPRSGVQVLDDITLQVRQGEFTAILGPNASGKSTLARLLAALLAPSAGSVVIDGLDSSRPENREQIKKKWSISSPILTTSLSAAS